MVANLRHHVADRVCSTSEPTSPTARRKFACRIPQSTGHDAIKIIPGRPAQVFIKFGRCTVALYALKLLLDRAFRDH
jgi:HlyD family secretion protein